MCVRLRVQILKFASQICSFLFRSTLALSIVAYPLAPLYLFFLCSYLSLFLKKNILYILLSFLVHQLADNNIMQLSLSALTTVALALTSSLVDAKAHSIKLSKLSNEETLDASNFQEYTNSLANKYLNLFNTAHGNPSNFDYNTY